MSERYMLGAYWGGRKEALGQCGDRLQKFLQELSSCDPLLATWYERQRSRKVSLGESIDIKNANHVRSALERGRNRSDIGQEVIEELGFRVGLWNGERTGKDAGLSITCGLHLKGPATSVTMSNFVILDLPTDAGALVNAEMMKRLTTIAAQTWEPDWAGVMSKDSMLARNFNARFPFVDWVLYIPGRIIDVPQPSSTVTVPGLGSIVTVQPLPPDANDPEQLAQIRRVEQVLLN